MLVSKVNSHYEFSSMSVDGAFQVKLILTDEQEEKLVTTLSGISTSFTPRDLEPGTIRKVVGEESWQSFQRMKEQQFHNLFIDPKNAQNPGVTSKKMTS